MATNLTQVGSVVITPVTTPAERSTLVPMTVFFSRGPDFPNRLLYGPSAMKLATISDGDDWQNPKDWTIQSWYHYTQGKLAWGTAPADIAAKDIPITPLAAIAPSSSAVSAPNVAVTPSVTPTGSVISTPTSNQTPPSNPEATAPQPQASKSPSNSKGGFSGGAVAGAAIGCLIAGALIAGLIFWFCWGKRKPSRGRDYEASALMPHEKGFATNAIPLGSGSSAAAPVAGALPLPLEDKAVTGEISKISNSIKNHVQSYYQMGRVSPGLIDLDDIHALGSSQPISAGTLSTLLDSATTREIALRFCIAWVVCSRMQPGADSKTSLLPIELAGCMGKMTNERRGSPGHSASELARWRVTTAELMQGSYVRDPFTASDSRNGSVQTAANTLENILRPFADSRMDNGERRRNLEEILKRSALFAFTLFSQPSTWAFDWQEKQGVKSGELCIFPALVQLTNETGQAVNPPRPFSEAVIRRLDE